MLIVHSDLTRAIATLYSGERLPISADWATLAEQATANDLAPLLYRALANHDAVPADILAQLRRVYTNVGVLHGLLRHRMHAVLAAFADAGIRVAVLKGAAFGTWLYDDVALRPIRDIDLLIAPADRPRAFAVLERLGYTPQTVSPCSDPSGLHTNALDFALDGPQRTVIELHWGIVDNPFYMQRVSAETLLSRALSLPSMSVLNPTDQLLHICLHAYHHHPDDWGLAGVDIALLLTKHGAAVEWDWLVSSAVKHQFATALHAVITFAAIDWAAPVPRHRLTQLAALPKTAREARFVQQQRSDFGRVWRTLSQLPSVKAKLRFGLRQLFPNRDFMAWRYGTQSSTPIALAYAKRYAQAAVHFVNDRRRLER